MFSIIKFFLAVSIFFSIFTTNASSQVCYSIRHITFGSSEIEDVDSAQFVFGVKNMVLELISDKAMICDNGQPVDVQIKSVKTPSSSFSIGVFESKSQKTIVECEVVVDDVSYFGEGENNVDVTTTLLELSNPDLPFERSSFAAALKKSLVSCFEQISW